MKITSGEKHIDVEVQQMNTDNRFSFWNGKTYEKVSHKALPTSSFLLGIAGRTASGKSTILASLLTASGKKSRIYRGVFNEILFIMNPQNMSSMSNNPYGEIPEENIYPNFDLPTLETIWERIKTNKENELETLLVVDDQISATRTHESFFHNMLLQHRHWSFSAIICVQDAKMLSPTLRSNMSGIILFRNENKIRLKILHEEYLSYLTNAEFQKVNQYIFRNHGDTLYIDLKSFPMTLYRNFQKLEITGYDSEIPI